MAVNAYLSIMRAFVAIRQLIANPPSCRNEELQQEMKKLRNYMEEIFADQVECDCRENLEAVNDLSEDMRKDIDAIYEAIGALSVKLPKIQNPAQKIGFKK